MSGVTGPGVTHLKGAVSEAVHSAINDLVHFGVQSLNQEANGFVLCFVNIGRNLLSKLLKHGGLPVLELAEDALVQPCPSVQKEAISNVQCRLAGWGTKQDSETDLLTQPR